MTGLNWLYIYVYKLHKCLQVFLLNLHYINKRISFDMPDTKKKEQDAFQIFCK